MSNKEISSKFPFESKFITVKGSQIHYIDEGSGDPILFIHGNPTSSYLWRNIIPYLKNNARCIALDLIGMGKSDQPDLNYGFEDTYAYLKAFIESLALKNITLVIHDWGSGLGFHYANEHRNNIKGIAFMEAMHKMVDWKNLPLRIKVATTLMRMSIPNRLMLGVANLFVKKVLPNGTKRRLSKEEFEYYATPYPTIKSRRAVRVWPQNIPIKGKPKRITDIVYSYHEWLKTTNIPKICFYADPGILIPQKEVEWIQTNFPNTTLVNVGPGLHFIQEDNPHKIGEELAKWYRNIE